MKLGRAGSPIVAAGAEIDSYRNSLTDSLATVPGFNKGAESEFWLVVWAVPRIPLVAQNSVCLSALCFTFNISVLERGRPLTYRKVLSSHGAWEGEQ